MHREQDLMPISGSSPSWLPGAPFSYHLQPQSRFQPLTNGLFPVGPNQFQGSMPSFALNAEFQNTIGSRNSINLVTTGIPTVGSVHINSHQFILVQVPYEPEPELKSRT